MRSGKLFCATVLYPYKEGAAFDFELYSRDLAPKYAEIVGENCVRFEVRRGLTTAGGPAPQFICIANFWISSGEQFGMSMGNPGMKALMARIAAFTDIQPLRQFDEVVA